MAFWLLIVLMTLAALAFLLAPLMRDPQAAQAARAGAALRAAHQAGALSRQELDAKLAALATPASATRRPPRALAATLAVLLPFVAIALYFRLGEPRALDAQAATAAAPAAGGAESTPPDMAQAIAGLADRLKSEPDNLDGWLLLGRALKSTERFAEARDALANAIRIAPNDPDAQIEYAEATALASPERRIEGEALAMIERAVRIQPQHQRGLWLLGVAAMQAQRPADAVRYWETLRALLGSDAEALASIDEQIEGARQAAGMPPAASAPAATPAATPAAPATGAPSAAKLTVKVDISPDLRAKLQGNEVLFVFARAASGPKMPLAIERMPAGQLPVTVELDDSDGMMPELKLSMMPEVVIGARISHSGQAIPQSGDFEVFSAPLPSTRSEPVELRIDQVVP